MEKILITHADKCLVLNQHDIIYCTACGNYSLFHLKDQKITSTKCLKKLSNKLNDNFLRISQSCLVNIHYIVEIIPKKKQILVSTNEFLDFTIKFSDLCLMFESRFKSQTKTEIVKNGLNFSGN